MRETLGGFLAVVLCGLVFEGMNCGARHVHTLKWYLFDSVVKLLFLVSTYLLLY